MRYNLKRSKKLSQLIKTYAKMIKPKTGGDVLLKTKGKAYFSELAKKRWEKHKAKLKQWEKLKKKKSETTKK